MGFLGRPYTIVGSESSYLKKYFKRCEEICFPVGRPADIIIEALFDILMGESIELTTSARERSFMTSVSLPDHLFPSQQSWGGLGCLGVRLTL